MSQQVTIIDRAGHATERVGAHRGGGIPVQNLPFDSDGHGFNLWASIGTIEDGYFSPRHGHNFDQIRFMLQGATQFSDWQLDQGCVGYFPESVAYGPQRQEGDSQIFTLQLTGASGRHYPLAADVRRGNVELKAKDPQFGVGGVGVDAAGVERDSFEILWEHLTGDRITYAQPRYNDVIVMRPDAYAWTGSGAVQLKALGRFTEYALEVEKVLLNGPQTLTVSAPDQSELWLQSGGHLQVGEHSYDGTAAWQFLGEARSIVVAAAQDAEFLVIRLPKARPAAQ